MVNGVRVNNPRYRERSVEAKEKTARRESGVSVG
jgi:hypothetical protein